MKPKLRSSERSNKQKKIDKPLARLTKKKEDKNN